MLEHQIVRPAPISKDTLLVPDANVKKTISIGKLLCEIGLHSSYILSLLIITPSSKA